MVVVDNKICVVVLEFLIISRIGSVIAVKYDEKFDKIHFKQDHLPLTGAIAETTGESMLTIGSEGTSRSLFNA